ncbi:hypothetical protein ABW19_dt0209540 [Dactylella cylindrospora]|nr:hypothetical protein ABW19_dt0209540 [Dactylella cylindrospora]
MAGSASNESPIVLPNGCKAKRKLSEASQNSEMKEHGASGTPSATKDGEAERSCIRSNHSDESTENGKQGDEGSLGPAPQNSEEKRPLKKAKTDTNRQRALSKWAIQRYLQQSREEDPWSPAAIRACADDQA